MNAEADASDPFKNATSEQVEARDATVHAVDAGTHECGLVTAATDLKPLHLAFAFDVSGSMGKGDKPWHDRTFKWDPVVAATRAFFEDDVSKGILASMTFFPVDETIKTLCEDASYATPDVPVTALPSTDFGNALDVIGKSPWRSGTPTVHVMNGVIAAVAAQAKAEPGSYAIVMVTDGHPEGCGNPDIQVVADAAAAFVSTAPTFVIGVANPPIAGAPDDLGNLDRIAVAGGTKQAFIVDTGNPTKTTQDFAAIVAQIRGVTLPCNAPIPKSPDGRSFDKTKVAVKYSSGQTSADLVYDPDCSGNGSVGWHYDDPHSPSQIALCDPACKIVQADPDAKLSFEFACEPVILVPE